MVHYLKQESDHWQFVLCLIPEFLEFLLPEFLYQKPDPVSRQLVGELESESSAEHIFFLFLLQCTLVPMLGESTDTRRKAVLVRRDERPHSSAYSNRHRAK